MNEMHPLGEVPDLGTSTAEQMGASMLHDEAGVKGMNPSHVNPPPPRQLPPMPPHAGTHGADLTPMHGGANNQQHGMAAGPLNAHNNMGVPGQGHMGNMNHMGGSPAMANYTDMFGSPQSMFPNNMLSSPQAYLASPHTFNGNMFQGQNGLNFNQGNGFPNTPMNGPQNNFGNAMNFGQNFNLNFQQEGGYEQYDHYGKGNMGQEKGYGKNGMGDFGGKNQKGGKWDGNMGMMSLNNQFGNQYGGHLSGKAQKEGGKGKGNGGKGSSNNFGVKDGMFGGSKGFGGNKNATKGGKKNAKGIGKGPKGVSDLMDASDRAKGKGKGGKAADNLPENPSDLLYDFRVRNRKVELLEIVPHVVEFAKDQYGSRLIQSKLAICDPDQKQLLYVAIRKEVRNLVLDPFANYVIQKFLEFGTLTQRRGLATELRGSAVELSYHMFGCWVMQRALEFLEGPGNSEQVVLANELQGEVLRLVANQNGNHVIQKCIEKMPTAQVDFIIHAFKGEVKRMSRHTYGCRVLQRLIEHCKSEQLSGIVTELLDEVEELAKDEYGNYVIQSIAERIDTPNRQHVIGTIANALVALSTDKYASNVCEKAMVYSTDEDRAMLMSKVLSAPAGGGSAPLLKMMEDRYANYIVQKMIELGNGEQKEQILQIMKTFPEDLRNMNYGKHIFGTLQRMGYVDKDQMKMTNPLAAPNRVGEAFD